MPRIGRTSVHEDGSAVNVYGPKQEIADGKIFALRRKKSLSEVVFDLLRPKVQADKAKHPEAYCDYSQPEEARK